MWHECSELGDQRGPLGLFHTSGSFTPVDATKGRYSKAVRVYDDLVLVIGEEGITALTPRWS